MILSMTGFGAGDLREESVSYRVEIRTVNNRYFKASMKLPEHLLRFEGDIEKMLRGSLGRGSISYALRVKDDQAQAAYEINVTALGHYVRQLDAISAGRGNMQIDLAGLLELPGICEATDRDEESLKVQFAVVAKVTKIAIDRLIEMRRVEGEALWRDLQEQCAGIRKQLISVAQRAPGVVEEYHKRLRTRVQQLLDSSSAELDKDALAREVAIFAERCDVNEEISRLGSHIDQFLELSKGPEPAGRKLDFLAQEMLREANTIGSKANDAQVARHVVEIKAAIDRIKEQVQNIE